MKIYFAGSIRGGRDDAGLYNRIIGYLQKFGHVMTEHVGSSTLDVTGDPGISDRDIHDRDMEWLMNSDVVVAEVTTVSLGVGYEIGRAVALGKKVICLYREQPGKRLSAMIAGCPGITVINYQKTEEVEKVMDAFLTAGFLQKL